MMIDITLVSYLSSMLILRLAYGIQVSAFTVISLDIVIQHT